MTAYDLKTEDAIRVVYMDSLRAHKIINIDFFTPIYCSRCTCVAWVPEREGIFVVSHADGNLYVYDKVSP